MPFEEFRPYGGRTRFGFPTVTIMRSGGMSLNECGYKELHEAPRVVVAFDRETKRIGIRPAEEGEGFGYRVHKFSNDSWWIPARAFLAYHDVPQSITRKYRAQMDERYLVIDLTVKPVHQERRKPTEDASGDKSEE